MSSGRPSDSQHPVLDDDLLALLACPETHQPLAWAEPGLIARINQAIAAGGLSRASGERLSEPVEAGLVRADARVLYPVEQGIPNLLLSDRIDLEQLPKNT